MDNVLQSTWSLYYTRTLHIWMCFSRIVVFLENVLQSTLGRPVKAGNWVLGGQNSSCHFPMMSHDCANTITTTTTTTTTSTTTTALWDKTRSFWIHFPTSEGVSEASERMSERSGGCKQSEQSRASERVSGASEQANGWVSDPVLQSVFLVVQAHSADEICFSYRLSALKVIFSSDYLLSMWSAFFNRLTALKVICSSDYLLLI